MDSIGNEAVNPKLAESAPNSTEQLHRQRAAPPIHAAPQQVLRRGRLFHVITPGFTACFTNSTAAGPKR